MIAPLNATNPRCKLTAFTSSTSRDQRPPFQHAPSRADRASSVSRISCAAGSERGSEQGDGMNRRSAMLLPASLLALSALGGSAQAEEGGRGLNRYIRKKKLEPLETYVPKVLAAKSQLALSGEIRLDDPGVARDILRSGAFYGIRDCVRALGEYATTNGTSSNANKLVDSFFLTLQTYDRALSLAARDAEKGDRDAKEVAAEKEDITKKLVAVVADMDALLATVPEEVMKKSEEVLAAFLKAEKRELEGGDAEPVTAEEEKMLESLLK